MQWRANQWIAAGLSLVFAGLGHLYLSSYRRASFFITLELATALLALYPQNLSSLTIVGAVANFAVTVTAAVDAYRLAKKRSSTAKAKKKDSAE